MTPNRLGPFKLAFSMATLKIHFQGLSPEQRPVFLDVYELKDSDLAGESKPSEKGAGDRLAEVYIHRSSSVV